MKITQKLISIPPYISTSWNNISSLHVSDKDLVITLKDDTRISVPTLTPADIEEIFAAHALFLEQQEVENQATKQPQEHITPSAHASIEQQMAAPFRILFGTLESLTQALQHNPAYSNLASLPQEIVEKIEMLGKTLPPEELANFLHPVSGCNCMYCQISRILKGDFITDVKETKSPHLGHAHIENTEDEVAEEDLHFEQWIIETIGNKMYQVTNKLDPNEHYSVYLGNPIGCTCGKQNCEHIVAVLRH